MLITSSRFSPLCSHVYKVHDTTVQVVYLVSNKCLVLYWKMLHFKCLTPNGTIYWMIVHPVSNKTSSSCFTQRHNKHHFFLFYKDTNNILFLFLQRTKTLNHKFMTKTHNHKFKEPKHLNSREPHLREISIGVSILFYFEHKALIQHFAKFILKKWREPF